MPDYEYVARDSQQKVVKGNISVATLAEARTKLEKQGLTISSIEVAWSYYSPLRRKVVDKNGDPVMEKIEFEDKEDGANIVGERPKFENVEPATEPRAEGGRVVQHHYVRAMARTLEYSPEEDQRTGISHMIKNDDWKSAVYTWLGQMMRPAKPYKPTKKDHLKLIKVEFNKLLKGMQEADLTINFDAYKWFKDENKHKSYTNDYQRSVDSISKKWVPPTKDHGLKRGADDRRVMGLDVVAKDPRWGGVTRLMDTKKGEEWNPNFVPSTRQVFAALDYGRRPHGSSVYYGFSRLILKAEHKVNAIYYPCDTALDNTDEVQATNPQPVDSKIMVTYSQLPSIATKAGGDMPTAIFQSCVLGTPQSKDVNPLYNTSLLLEAHLYKPVPISKESIEKAIVCFKFCNSADFGTPIIEWEGKRTEPYKVPKIVDDLRTNATKWANAAGIPLEFCTCT